jgi:hypothetical protein
VKIERRAVGVCEDTIATNFIEGLDMTVDDHYEPNDP